MPQKIAYLACLLALPASAEPLLVTPTQNSYEITQGQERLWCVEMPGFGLRSRCWPVPPPEQYVVCQRFPVEHAVVCSYPDGRVVTRREGEQRRVRVGL